MAGKSVGILALSWLIAGSAVAQAKPIDLSFSNLLVTGSRSLKPSPKLLAANGKRVRITGHMAQMEDAPTGGFWLCPRAVFQDESGAGSGELPPNAIFVQVRGAGKKSVAFLAGPLTVTGKLFLKAESPRIIVVLDSSQQIKPTPRKGSQKL